MILLFNKNNHQEVAIKMLECVPQIDLDSPYRGETLRKLVEYCKGYSYPTLIIKKNWHFHKSERGVSFNATRIGSVPDINTATLYAVNNYHMQGRESIENICLQYDTQPYIDYRLHPLGDGTFQLFKDEELIERFATVENVVYYYNSKIRAIRC